MGGQACVFYGAAEFSRDTDLAILADVENLRRLQEAMSELDAKVIAVPSFEASHLDAGHAIHFRCGHPEALGMRVDIMSKMRGVDSFPSLWERRTTLELADGTTCDLLSLPDLVLAKKTQRDKDWPMIRRLVEAHYFGHRGTPNSDQIRFWLRELRTPSLLVEITRSQPHLALEERERRPLLSFALAAEENSLEIALQQEEFHERQADRDYWIPLKRELEQFRHPR